MKHISEVWDLFAKCKTEEELEEAVGEIPSKFGLFYVGAGNGDRTRDLSLGKAALYH